MNACFVCDSRPVQKGKTHRNSAQLWGDPPFPHWLQIKHVQLCLKGFTELILNTGRWRRVICGHTHPHKHCFRKTRKATEVTLCQLASGDKTPAHPCSPLDCIKRASSKPFISHQLICKTKRKVRLVIWFLQQPCTEIATRLNCKLAQLLALYKVSPRLHLGDQIT